MNDPMLDPNIKPPTDPRRLDLDPKSGETEDGCCTAPPDTDPGPPG
jgi:hypothetical protein